MIVTQIDVLIGKTIQSQTRLMKPIGQIVENGGQLTFSGQTMIRRHFKIDPAHILVIAHVGGTSFVSTPDILVENTRDKQGVIANMRPNLEGLILIRIS